ncbi:hypothetical protein [Streptomyces sp. WG5]|uniref:hypothetical protein n=1 Tax=Streptomyces sp. WG5 TaxID=3417648 RepID=UPI003CFB9516
MSGLEPDRGVAVVESLVDGVQDPARGMEDPGDVAQVVRLCGACGEGERVRGDRSTGAVAVSADQVDDGSAGLHRGTEHAVVRRAVRGDRRQPAGCTGERAPGVAEVVEGVAGSGVDRVPRLAE